MSNTNIEVGAIIPRDDVVQELLDLVNEGLLNMGVDHQGNTVYWATEEGSRELDLAAP